MAAETAGSGYGSGPQLSLSPAELDGIARPIVDELRVSHPGRAVEITAKGDLSGRWDVGRIGQVVSNLLDDFDLHRDLERRDFPISAPI